MRRAFAEMDANKDGFLSEEELMKGLKKVGFANVSRDQVAKLAANLDRDGDGKIDFEEFVVMFSQD